jgi:hypothetical protein
MRVRCRHCGSPQGDPCVGAPSPGKSPRARRPLRFTPAHPSRIEDAAKARGLSEADAKRLAYEAMGGAVALYRKTNPAAPQMPAGKPKVHPSPETGEKPPAGQLDPKAAPSEPEPEPTESRE